MKMETEFNLSEELEKADWNIEDVWDMKKPEAREVVDKILKEFIRLLKDKFKVNYKQVWGINQIKEIIDKLAGDNLK